MQVSSSGPMVELDPNADLVSSLLSAATNQLARSLSSAQEVLGGGLGRAMRLIEPPPIGVSRLAPFAHGALVPLPPPPTPAPGFPPGPPGDQAVNLLVDPLRFLESVTDEYGSVVGLLLGTERVVLVTSKEAARQVGGRGGSYSRAGRHCGGLCWCFAKLLRYRYSITINPSRICTVFQVMVEQADIFVKQGTAFFPGSALAGNGLLVRWGRNVLRYAP